MLAAVGPLVILLAEPGGRAWLVPAGAFGTMPVAALIAGALGGRLGLWETMAAMMAVHSLATLTALIPGLSPFARLRDYPTREAVGQR